MLLPDGERAKTLTLHPGKTLTLHPGKKLILHPGKTLTLHTGKALDPHRCRPQYNVLTLTFLCRIVCYEQESNWMRALMAKDCQLNQQGTLLAH